MSPATRSGRTRMRRRWARKNAWRAARAAKASSAVGSSTAMSAALKAATSRGRNKRGGRCGSEKPHHTSVSTGAKSAPGASARCSAPASWRVVAWVARSPRRRSRRRAPWIDRGRGQGLDDGVEREAGQRQGVGGQRVGFDVGGLVVGAQRGVELAEGRPSGRAWRLGRARATPGAERRLRGGQRRRRAQRGPWRGW